MYETGENLVLVPFHLIIGKITYLFLGSGAGAAEESVPVKTIDVNGWLAAPVDAVLLTLLAIYNDIGDSIKLGLSILECVHLSTNFYRVPGVVFQRPGKFVPEKSYTMPLWF
ncbi:hypothetical protein ATCV1_z770R [Acanthocystis turfacea chlorella virus 1]|uniref:Uncharacterized protein z770R n=1 Tax=Chlorovirus heliozoae TaxID=322019 RepID=A7KA30_9PHYC|nr:hypothetical protein ATCV1_z770R [Acanthocystis turfacea chlorella virus 1]ABT16904.1 hypothetical protein ATCV1_z770R [Acanthocystis turfacea chlorella virus 1]